ncbi:serine/threonine protein kinase, partial [Streptomyces sp. NPDC002530]
LPQAPGHGRRAAAGRARSRPRRTTREAIRRRPRVASAIAGVIAFFAAVYLGMSLFSPDSSSATTPQETGPSGAPASPGGGR